MANFLMVIELHVFKSFCNTMRYVHFVLPCKVRCEVVAVLNFCLSCAIRACLTVDLTYMAPISPNFNPQCACGMKEVFGGLGIELGYLVGMPCVWVMHGWRIVYGVAVLFVLIMKSGLVSK